MRRTSMVVSIFGAFAVVAATNVMATPNLANGEKIFKEGKGSVPACLTCHGEDGMGNDMMGTPRLAGQVAEFLRKQLTDFATDKRTDTTMFVMNANAKGLTAQDREDVAVFLASLKHDESLAAAKPSDLNELKSSGVEVGKPYLGKAIVLYGIEEKGVPACKSCHGFNGRGSEPVYPQLSGQRYVYLMNQLKKWRDGTRANDPLQQMQKVAQKLSDADMMNAASYLTGAPTSTMGHGVTPPRHSELEHEAMH